MNAPQSNEHQNPQATEPAFPCEGPNATAYGLTKRELFAAMAMQGVITTTDASQPCPPELVALAAVKCADALLAALTETQS